VRSYNGPIIEKSYEKIFQVISLNGPPLFYHYGDNDLEDQEKPLICEDQRFNIFNHDLKRFEERRFSSKRNMPDLFGHKEKNEYFLAEHHLNDHN
jgi:hypothetical protein